MRLAFVILLGACGRVGFDTQPAPDSAAASYASAVLADHPLAYFRFDETAGTIAADASGHGNDGTYSLTGGTIDYAVAGALHDPSDRAVALAGLGNAGANTQAYVLMPPTVYPWAGDFTIEAWVLPVAPPPVGFDNALLIWENYSVSGFRTGWTPTMLPELWTTEGGGTSDIRSTTPIPIGVWSHLAFTKQATTVTIYLDAAVIATGPVDLVVPPIDADNGIGSDHGMFSNTTFDELAIYGVALSPAQIATHYAASGS